MDAEERLYSVIKDLCAGRVYPEKYNQGEAYPGIVYSRTGSETFSTMCGTRQGGKGYFRVEILSDTLAEAKAIGFDVMDLCKDTCVIINVYNDINLELEKTTRIIELSVWDD